MFLFLKFLALKMKTIDGIKNSADKMVYMFMKKQRLSGPKDEDELRFSLWKKTC